jgi:hypothetical protein
MTENLIERPEIASESPGTIIYLQPSESRWLWPMQVIMCAVWIVNGYINWRRYGDHHWASTGLLLASIMLGLGIAAHFLIEWLWGKPRLELSTRGIGLKRGCIGAPVMFAPSDIRSIELTPTRVILGLKASDSSICIPLQSYAVAQTVKGELKAFSAKHGIPLR